MDKDHFNVLNGKMNHNYFIDLVTKANQTVRSQNQKFKRKQMRDRIDKEYFNVLNGKINFQINDNEYINLIATKANQTVRPLTLRLRMKQMKEKMDEEINISKIKHENIQYQQYIDDYYKNIFFLHKKRKNQFINKSMFNQGETKSPLTQRNFTNYSPQRQTQQFNKTMLPSSPIINKTKIKVQQYQDYLQINQQINQHNGQLNVQILNLLEQKVQAISQISHIAKSLKQSCIKSGVDSYQQTLKTIQILKNNITQKVIKECNSIYEEKQNHQLNILEKTYTYFLRVLEVIQQMDDQIYQYMLNQKSKNAINDHNSILEDINQMRDDAYNEKVRTFSKYHDIDQEKKRDRQKLNKVKAYF